MKKKRKIILYLFVLAAAAGLFAIWILAGRENPGLGAEDIKTQGIVRVHFLDAGQGDSILIQSEGENLLIDAGTNEDEELVVSYLKEQGVEYLDYVIATHPHIDHIGGMDAVLETFPVGIFFLPEEEYDTESYQDVEKALKQKEIRMRHPDFLENYEIGSARFVFITPNSRKQYEDPNDASLGIRLTNGAHSFLLCGDISKSIEAEILASGVRIWSDVLKLNHHGSSDANSWEFLKAVDPSFVVVTCAPRNEFGHPHEKVMKRVEKLGAGVFRTDRQGAIVFDSDGKRLKSSTAPEDEEKEK